MEILYKVHNNLYVNLTNKCPCDCVFCLRNSVDRVGESGSLWLEREPGPDEVIDAFRARDMDKYGEVVYCGFGEPTEALDVMLPAMDFVKEHYNNPIRLNTNGLGNLIHGRDITPDLKGRTDTVSISLNTPDAARYNALVRSKFGECSFDAMLDFARKCARCVPKVILSTVSGTISKEEEAECKKICDGMGAIYRIRPYEK